MDTPQISIATSIIHFGYRVNQGQAFNNIRLKYLLYFN
jgi:hypothetical protein